jgi:hypothetical protein
MYSGYEDIEVNIQRRDRDPKTVTIGFAERAGRGVAYAVSGSAGRGAVVRVEFACRPLPALLGRDVAYAALQAVAEAYLARGVTRAVFRIDDAKLPQDIAERRALPNALILPYVRLRCVLNRFHAAAVEAAADDVARDASARARADVQLTFAA